MWIFVINTKPFSHEDLQCTTRDVSTFGEKENRVNHVNSIDISLTHSSHNFQSYWFLAAYFKYVEQWYIPLHRTLCSFQHKSCKTGFQSQLILTIQRVLETWCTSGTLLSPMTFIFVSGDFVNEYAIKILLVIWWRLNDLYSII